ncbi:DNA-binding response regulator [Amycolatopsis sp. WAC 01375]|uniref:response regulator n=1 Tax=unclassified Amycolatopsis TaxID=2618356 RepID=UPI000F7B4185|nr:MULTISPECIES: response regulator transcription factor [unclassified Amycolatopsis]RSM75294.1 DNA-binding response regulator [Amycolatopsis sp. WAC 01375]RSN35659.1 DNA-binding response regulator [Amycolatopsis sp. WAC 01416]
MTTVFIVDDQALVRESFAGLLNAQPGLDVVGQAGDGIAALAGLSALATPPDVVLMDIRMPVMDGLEATRRLLEGDGEKPKVLVLTTFHLDEYVYEALRAGASGFLLKDAPSAELINAIEVVAAGDALLSPAVTKRLIANFVASAPVPRPSPARFDVLTEREREVLRLIAKGRSNPEIAADLVLSAQTIKTYVGRILAKLGLRDRAQAIVLAYEAGLVSPT